MLLFAFKDFSILHFFFILLCYKMIQFLYINSFGKFYLLLLYDFDILYNYTVTQWED